MNSVVCAVIDSTHVEVAEPVVNKPLHVLIPGKFTYHFPRPINAPANAYWAVRLQFASILNRIGNLFSNDSYGFWIRNSAINGDQITRIELTLHSNFVSSVENLINLLNALIPGNLVGQKKIYFDLINNTCTLYVNDGMVILGKKLAACLGILDKATSTSAKTAIYGDAVRVFSSTLVSPSIHRLGASSVRIYASVVQPSIVGKKFSNLLAVVNAASMRKQNNYDLQPWLSFTSNGINSVYRDLSENVVQSVTLSFMDENDELLNFCPTLANEPLFTLSLEFKRLQLYF